jgi:hypothetical protein
MHFVAHRRSLFYTFTHPCRLTFAGAVRRCRLPVRCRGPRRESASARLMVVKTTDNAMKPSDYLGLGVFFSLGLLLLFFREALSVFIVGSTKAELRCLALLESDCLAACSSLWCSPCCCVSDEAIRFCDMNELWPNPSPEPSAVDASNSATRSTSRFGVGSLPGS